MRCHPDPTLGILAALALLHTSTTQDSQGPEFELHQPELFADGGTFTNAFADYDNDGEISLKELDLYVTRSVKTLTRGQQRPTYHCSSKLSGFSAVCEMRTGRVDETLHIRLCKALPLRLKRPTRLWKESTPSLGPRPGSIRQGGRPPRCAQVAG